MAHSVALSWAAPVGSTVASYNVKRGTVTGGPYTAIGSTSVTSYTDAAGLAEGQKYFYVVDSVNPAGESGPSNEVSVTIPFSIPAPPTSLVATAV